MVKQNTTIGPRSAHWRCLKTKGKPPLVVGTHQVRPRSLISQQLGALMAVAGSV